MQPEYIVPGIFSGIDDLVALQTTRKGGVSPPPFGSLNLGRNTEDSMENVRENTAALCRALQIAPERLAGSDQVHGTGVLHARRPGCYRGYDALVTASRDVYLCIFTADCFPVLLCDPENRAVAAIHAGWKGTAGAIVAKTIELMQQQFHSNPGNLFAWIGTGISQPSYEVDMAVAAQFPSAHHIPAAHEKKKALLDLGGANRTQLLGAGVPERQIESSPFCASGDSELFYSYRRDAGRTGRMASIIGLRPR
ncbi:MAG: peptidoglycan editing factor PgeF [Chlorobium sp.]|uniref:peptidoglycan editing factor PgeF n=1 Tax=Chlorobium sp. TaxID=1095 RepID=UPI0025BD8FAE|nr:peptidoglycan editing factor PgeF [Chlorobium sp.]MCF8382189.1 peptidoglycan editing factor PgeF [Chlorobium sp.]